ncbi:MAG: tetratricopeptide repeat protein [Bacteroidales bacterium]|nr:tetratricopeptide repeat protein [Bacteroidales bacterium]
MTRKELDHPFETLYQDIRLGNLKEALDELSRLIRITNKPDYFYPLETLSDNYKTLLQYAFEGYHDPEQKNILNGLYISILAIADEINLWQRENNLLFTKTEKLSLNNDLYESSLSKINQLFKQIWLTGKVSADFMQLIQKIIPSTTMAWHDKCLVVSGITMSLLHHFDIQKFQLLIDFIELHESQVYQRALTGLCLGLLVYDQRLRFYPDFLLRLKSMALDENLAPEMELVILQLLTAQETDRITQEFEEEVLPEMKKMMPKIEDKLQLGDLSQDEDLEGKNPGWKDMIEEVPGLFEKIEKFSKMQMEGQDVFMSTFKLLKRFDFFNNMANWFVPFYRDHPEIRDSFSPVEEINDRLLESLEKAFYICNSDKYSFAINFQAIPAQQRTMIVTNFEAEFAQMKEMASEEQLLDQSLASNAIYIQYIQDLYRFFKLFPARNEFNDVFKYQIRLPDLNFYKSIFERNGFTERIASFFFDKDHHEEAIVMYRYLLQKIKPNGEYFEKIGYCFQKTGAFQEAIEYYKKAELFDTNQLWILKKLGWCNLKLKDYHQALGYFKDAAALVPEDTTIQQQVAQCYLHLNDYKQASVVYNKLRFFTPDNLKIIRPLAWCLFVLGNLEQADELYHKVLEESPRKSAYDLMNAAHIKLCLRQKKEALDLYKQAFSLKSPGKEALLNAYREDIQVLINNGIPEIEIPLIRDYLLFQSEP